MDRNKAEMRKLKNTMHLLQNDGGLLFGLQAGMHVRTQEDYPTVGLSSCVLSSLLEGQRGGRHHSAV